YPDRKQAGADNPRGHRRSGGLRRPRRRRNLLRQALRLGVRRLHRRGKARQRGGGGRPGGIPGRRRRGGGEPPHPDPRRLREVQGPRGDGAADRPGVRLSPRARRATEVQPQAPGAPAV
ncbi:unnamed protein product, partial [Ectocarpus sp. 4 AP-2014]